MTEEQILVKKTLYLLRPRSFGRFVIVGGVNTLVGIGSFPLLYWLFNGRIGINALLVAGWIFSTSFAFTLHRLVTFKSSGAYHHEGAKFLLLSLIILGINLTVMNLMLHFTGVHPVLIQFVTSVALTVGLMIFNFFGMKRFIFTAAPKPDSLGK